MKTGVGERERQKSADHDGRSKAQQKFTAWAGKQFRVGAMGFGGGGGRGDGHRDECLDEPNGKPALGRGLVGSGVGRDKRGQTHGYATPAGNRSEFAGALHGFADVAEMVGSTDVDGDRCGRRRAKWSWNRHGKAR